jgi:hypothetical protein
VPGVSRETLQQHGRSISEVVSALNRDLVGLTVFCDGWAQDHAWLAALFKEVGRAPLFKLESAHRCLNEQQRPPLAAQQQVRAEIELQRHRASSDALLLQRALEALGAMPAVQPICLAAESALAEGACPCACSCSCNLRHITLPAPLLGSASTNCTMRGTL